MDGPPNPPRDPDAAIPVLADERAAPALWGAFELRELVGRGGFGEVYRAWDPSLQREVGLKILLPRSHQTESGYDEILREARTLAAIRHPNILPVYGVDRHNQRVGFWTDFVNGKTLAALVRDQGPFGYREAALIGLDVCRALSAVHRAGIFHCDIKAENVMREEGGRILLMDFGLSALGGDHAGTGGTPLYMAPELLGGEPASVASDIYAVGVLLFFLVTARFPTESEPVAASSQPDSKSSEWDPNGVTVTHVAVPIAAPSGAVASTSFSILDRRPDLPEAFARVIETALNPDPARRFATAGAFSSALSEVLGIASTEPISSAPRTRTGKRILVGAALLLIALGSFAAVRRFHLFGLHQTSTDNAPASVNEQFLKADALLERYDIHKNVTDAIDILDGVLSRDPNFAPAQAALGRAYFLEYRVNRAPGELDKARDACNRAISLNSSLVRPHAVLAWVEAAAGHIDLATQEANQAVSLNSRSAEAYGAQATVLDAEGRTADAIAAAQKAADLAPDYWGWPVLLGNYDYYQGKLDDARNEYRQAATVSPDNALVELDLGLIALQLGQYAEAQADLEKSAQIQPSFLAYGNLAEVFVAEGKYQQTIDASRKALGLDQTNYLAWGNLASAYLWVPSDHDKAIDTYRTAAQLAEAARKDSPDDPVLLANLGGYYAFIGQNDRSVAMLRQALSLAPDNPEILFVVGDGYEVLHRRSDAIPLIARSIALGFNVNQLQRSAELTALRADPKFQKALQAATAKH
jgi:eukaryotic-like serine/threonine-protein kinase